MTISTVSNLTRQDFNIEGIDLIVNLAIKGVELNDSDIRELSSQKQQVINFFAAVSEKMWNSRANDCTEDFYFLNTEPLSRENALSQSNNIADVVNIEIETTQRRLNDEDAPEGELITVVLDYLDIKFTQTDGHVVVLSYVFEELVS